MTEGRPLAIVHVDADGADDIYAAHGWKRSFEVDPIFQSGFANSLRFFERNRIQATYFVVANSLDNPCKRELVQEALRRGHAVASHSLTHPQFRQIGAERKRHEIWESRAKIEKVLGITVKGFRAPGYQIDREAVELLAAAGYKFDSSAFPMPSFARALRVPEQSLAEPSLLPIAGALLELPLPDYRPLPVPFSPSYALLLSTLYFRIGLSRFLRTGKPFVLLFHLIDMADPLPGLYLHQWRKRIFTLSLMSAARRLSRCQAMLDLTRQHYDLTTTDELLRPIEDKL